MRVLIQVVSGSRRGQTVQLQSGQAARFGRTEWADYSLPDDPNLAEIHFAIEANPAGCRVHDLSRGAGTMVNGAPVDSVAFVNTGDTITAGQTHLVVQVDGEVSGQVTDAGAAASPQPEAEPVPEPTGPQLNSTVELANHLELDETATELAAEGQSPREYIRALSADEQFAAATSVLAYCLPRRQAVWWAHECVARTLPEIAELPTLTAARTWVTEPTDTNRRAAMAAVDECGYETPASWVALSAFWSGGSMSEPDLPEVPPDDRLTSQAVSASLQLAAVSGEADEANGHFAEFLELGEMIGDGSVPLPSAK